MLSIEQRQRFDELMLLELLGTKVLEKDRYWVHFTDISENYDAWKRLLTIPFLELDPFLVYTPDGSWQDHFPPLAYKVTQKALAALSDKYAYIHEGTIDGY